VQAALLRFFREFLIQRRFTEIITLKIVESGTEGGTNLFELKFFDRVAYLAQSPQFYKEHAVAGFERVFETGHVYRAEPHATSRHLTEYYSLDVEFGFIEGPEEIIQLERELLTFIFERLACEQEIDAFMECARAYARPAILKHAIRMLMPTPEHTDNFSFISLKGAARPGKNNLFLPRLWRSMRLSVLSL
jgi:nondiscriminating aspartyl-tRNA synthetase